ESGMGITGGKTGAKKGTAVKGDANGCSDFRASTFLLEGVNGRSSLSNAEMGAGAALSLRAAGMAGAGASLSGLSPTAGSLKFCSIGSAVVNGWTGMAGAG